MKNHASKAKRRRRRPNTSNPWSTIYRIIPIVALDCSASRPPLSTRSVIDRGDDAGLAGDRLDTFLTQGGQSCNAERAERSFNVIKAEDMLDNGNFAALPMIYLLPPIIQPRAAKTVRPKEAPAVVEPVAPAPAPRQLEKKLMPMIVSSDPWRARAMLQEYEGRLHPQSEMTLRALAFGAAIESQPKAKKWADAY